MKFFLFTLVGSAFLLVGIIATAFLAKGNVDHMTFDLIELVNKANFSVSTGSVVVLCVRRRVRREGADLPVAHLAARCAHAGTHRRAP